MQWAADVRSSMYHAIGKRLKEDHIEFELEGQLQRVSPQNYMIFSAPLDHRYVLGYHSNALFVSSEMNTSSVHSGGGKLTVYKPFENKGFIKTLVVALYTTHKWAKVRVRDGLNLNILCFAVICVMSFI